MSSVKDGDIAQDPSDCGRSREPGTDEPVIRPGGVVTLVDHISYVETVGMTERELGEHLRGVEAGVLALADGG